MTATKSNGRENRHNQMLTDKLKVDAVGLLLRFLYAYNSICFLKAATPLWLPT